MFVAKNKTDNMRSGQKTVIFWKWASLLAHVSSLQHGLIKRL